MPPSTTLPISYTPALLHIRTDPLSGRKYHASAALPAGTDLFGNIAPYACTIWKRFRNEVCAECWRYDGGRRTFLTRRDDHGLGPSSTVPPNGDVAHPERSSTTAGLWFCDAKCQRGWVTREGLAAVDLLRQLEPARQKKLKPKPKPNSGARAQRAVDTDELELTPESVERAWDAVRDKERSPKVVRRWRDLQLEDYEADMARYVLLALNRCLREQCNPLLCSHSKRNSDIQSETGSQSEGPTEANGYDHEPSEWETFASLQVNELQLLNACPQILQHQHRIYQLLKGKFGSPAAEKSGPAGRTLEPNLADLVTIANVRTILGVDPGNAFGIWEVPLMEESECLGFALYPVASFFNHHCAANVRKERDGRRLRFVTTCAVEAGEELCISYGHAENMDLAMRQKELLEGWYFECRCSRCISEGEGEGTGTDREGYGDRLETQPRRKLTR
ncbi:SET domain-containing protein [Trametes gibbosa]|nr:SET domain-containing protein [Trametes gibbosa]